MTLIKITAYSRDGDFIKEHEWDGSDRLVLGKSSSCNFTIKNKYVSRQHGLLIERNGSLIFFDLNSLNGTYKDGKRVEHARLEPGDEFRIGPITLKLEKITADQKNKEGSGVMASSEPNPDESESDKASKSSSSSIHEQIQNTGNGSPDRSPPESSGSTDSNVQESADSSSPENRKKNEEEKDRKASSSQFIPIVSILLLVLFGIGVVFVVSSIGISSGGSEEPDSPQNVEESTETPDNAVKTNDGSSSDRDSGDNVKKKSG